MKVTKKEEATKVLDEIIALNGNCLDVNRCKRCPLRERCHPTFYQSPEPVSRFMPFERVNLALEILTQEIVMDDDEYAKDNIDTAK